MTQHQQQPDLDAIQTRLDAASKGPWKLAYEYCDCSEDCGHGLYVSRIDTGSGPATELCDLPRGEWELMVHARQDVEELVAEVRRLRDQLEDQADADTVADRAARAISAMGADLRAMTSERNRYRNAWHNARARAADAEDNTKFTEEQQPAAPAARSAAV